MPTASSQYMRPGSVYEFIGTQYGESHIDLICWPSKAVEGSNLLIGALNYVINNMYDNCFLVLETKSLNRKETNAAGLVYKDYHDYVHILTDTGDWWVDMYFFNTVPMKKIC